MKLVKHVNNISVRLSSSINETDMSNFNKINKRDIINSPNLLKSYIITVYILSFKSMTRIVLRELLKSEPIVLHSKKIFLNRLKYFLY